MLLPRHTATRYLQPLREGGSLPAVVDTDGGRFVVKFRGAGQGAKALVAEIVEGLIARELQLPAPDLALIEIPAPLGRGEPDPEIQDLLRASHGINVGLRYLDGAFNFSLAAAQQFITPDFAARVVWLDAFVTNPDRSHRNPNILLWGRQPWLIDHGAALYAHHDWASVDEERTRRPFQMIRDHVLLGAAGDIGEADSFCAPLLTADALAGIVEAIPDELLTPRSGDVAAMTPNAERDRYRSYLSTRIAEPRAFVREAAEARMRAMITEPRSVPARR